MTNQLIIIGNGFDLACGLKSSYGDFFREYFKNELGRLQEVVNEKEATTNNNDKISKINEIEELPTHEKNFWLIYFWETKKPTDGKVFLWSDIENSIKEVIECIDDDYYEFKTGDTKISQIYEKWKKKRTTTKRVLKEEEGISLLFEDLIELEFKFKEYLNQMIKVNKNYKEKVNNLIYLLIFIFNRKNWDNPEIPIDIDTKILSFNYTNVFENEKNYFDNRVTNIHGSLNSEVIFGIDEFKSSTKNCSIFTKTYRLMQKSSAFIGMSPNLESIKFFGHGLGEADYSYFQSIFDITDLYSSGIGLVFFYYVYDEEKRYEIQKDTTDNVYKLINEYGQTLDNKDHGKNLLHKLLIEGRIVVKELNVSEYLK